MNSTIWIALVIGVLLVLAIVYVVRRKGRCPECTPDACAHCTSACAYKDKNRNPAQRLEAEADVMKKRDEAQLSEEEKAARETRSQHKPD